MLQEMHEAEHEGSEEAHRYGEYPWEVVIDLPHIRDGQALAKQAPRRGPAREATFPLRCWSARRARTRPSSSGERLEGEAPEGSRIGVRGNPDDMPLPTFVNLSALKPGFLRDLGL